MKKILSIIIVLTIVLSSFSTLVFADADKVEITFCVGDDTLSINGNDVKVEKPYVVGDGVTLVPLRVITEAFGVKVGWEDSTKTITLSYPDVEIILQIGNPVAEVNKKAVTLLAAPELPASTTMVPLRFISETFGALVNYDEKTEKITVVKETKAEGSATVQGSVDSKRIGDSYYGWSMENPVDMTMSYRSFEGDEIEFSYDNNNFLSLSVYEPDETYSFDSEFGDVKESFSNYTLVKADKDVLDPSKKKMHFQAKDKERHIEMVLVCTEKYIYDIVAICQATSTEKIKEMSRIILSFVPEFTTEATHDLSTIKEGFRKYESINMKYSFNVPVDFVLVSSENVENSLAFLSKNPDDRVSSINVGIYSISQTGNAKELCKKDYDLGKEISNRSVVTFSESVKERKYETLNSFEYSVDINAAKYKAIKRDVFFDAGDYVYNFAFVFKNPDAMVDHKIDNIINSIKAEVLNPDEIGILMRNDPEYEGEHVVKVTDWSMTVPNAYTDQQTSNMVQLTNKVNGSVILIYFAKSTVINVNELKHSLSDIVAKVKGKGGTVIVPTRSTYKGKLNCFETVYQITEGDITVYSKVIVGVHGGKEFAISFTIDELSYSEKAIEEFDNIVKTILVEK